MHYSASLCSWIVAVPWWVLLLSVAQSTPRCKCGSASSSAQSDSGASNKPHDENFVIGNDDVLAISVWKEPELTKAVPVRSDGKISLPLVGEMQAAGAPRFNWRRASPRS